MKRTCVLLLLMVGLSTTLFAMTAEERKNHDSELKNHYETHESLYIYTHRPMDVKVEVKKKELKTGVDSTSLTKLSWDNTKSWTKDKLVTAKQASGKTFKTSNGDIFSDYYYELRVPYRRYLLTSDFIAALKEHDFQLEEAAAEYAIAVAAGVTALFCPAASTLAVSAAVTASTETYLAVKDFKPFRKNMEKANTHNYKLAHYYYEVTIDGHTAILSQSLIDYYQGSVYFDSDTKTFTKGPKGTPIY